MTIDFLLSALHFLLVFLLVAILAAQGALIRPGMALPGLRLAAKLDRGYGALATMLRIGHGARIRIPVTIAMPTEKRERRNHLHESARQRVDFAEARSSCK